MNKLRVKFSTPPTVFLLIAISHVFFLFTLIPIIVSQDTTGFFYCSDLFCENRLREFPCPAKRNCSSVGFRTFLDPSECNCCDYCFDYLNENDTCSLTSPQKVSERGNLWHKDNYYYVNFLCSQLKCADLI